MAKKIDNLSDIWKLKQRGRRDSNRHKELINRAIRKHGKDLITEYNIITSDGNKKVKVPIKFLEQYKFKYGKLRENNGTGQGLGHPEAGKKYKIGQKPDTGAEGGPGNEPGSKSFEAEVSIDELVDILLEELKLPWMDPNNSDAIEIETEELSSIEKVGIMPNIDLKRTLIENIRRNAAKGDPTVGSFHQNDLRYKTWEDEIEYQSNAAVYMMMDRSGSMDPEKTYIAKSFYFWMVQFLKRRYKNIKLYFIAHDAQAYMVEEKEFFKISSNGGTKCSSAYKLAYDHILQHHSPDTTNVYVMEFSDGDNWIDDNIVCIDYVKKLMDLCKAVGYGEIVLDNIPWQRDEHLLSAMLNKNIQRTRFVTCKLTSRDDVFEALKTFFNVEGKAKAVKEKRELISRRLRAK